VKVAFNFRIATAIYGRLTYLGSSLIRRGWLEAIRERAEAKATPRFQAAQLH
jgi:hypothetical protein